MDELPEEQRPIQTTDRFYRRIPNVHAADFIVVDDATGRSRMSSGNFEPDDDGVSIYIARVLHAYNLTFTSILERTESGIGELTLESILAGQNSLVVHPDPWPKDVPDPTHLKHAAHALIKGLGSLSRGARKREQRRLAAECEIVHDPRSS